MSDTLFGGSDSLAAIQSNLQDVMKKIEGLTTVVKARNPTKQDAIMMQEGCPSGLVGCHPAKLNEASGGLLNCPTAEHLPDPIIVDSKGRFCYAPKAIRDVLDGKDLNIQSLQKKYSEKILDMLKDGSNLAVAVQSLTSTAPGSSYIINMYANNNFVRQFVQGHDADAARGVRALAPLPATETKDTLAALLTRFSNSLNPYTGGTFVSSILAEQVLPQVPIGLFDEMRDVPRYRPTGRRSVGPFEEARRFGEGRAEAAGFGAPAGPGGDARLRLRIANYRASLAAARAAGAPNPAPPAGLADAAAAAGLSLEGGELSGGARRSDAIHLRISEVILASMVYTYSNAKMKSEIVKLLDALGTIIDFDEKNLGIITPSDPRTTFTIARDALLFIPEPLRVDLHNLAIQQLGIAPQLDDSRAMLETFVLFCFQNVYLELLNKKESKFIPALLVMQNAYKTMRDKEVVARDLLKEKKRGDSVSKTEIDDVVRTQVAARREYVLSARAFNNVLVDLDEAPVFYIEPRATPPEDDTIKHRAELKIRQLLEYEFIADDFNRFCLQLNKDFDTSAAPVLVKDARSDLRIEKADFYRDGEPARDTINPTFESNLRERVADVKREYEGAGRARFARREFGAAAAPGGAGAVAGGDLNGGHDFEPIDGGELDEAFFGLIGGKAPEHFMPKEILDVGKDREGIIDKELQKKFKSLGYGDIPVFYSKKCPMYATENNTLGGKNRTWIATKHPWTKCQELLGYQMVSEEGYCYPQGAYCYPEDDIVTVTKKTVQAVDSWLSTAKLYNSIMKKKYDSFLTAEIARIRASGIDADMTDKEVEELALSHMPVELQPLSEYAATTSLVLTSNAFNDAVSQITNSSDTKQREEIRKILFETLAFSEDWVRDDVTQQNDLLDKKAKDLQEDAKKCTDASLLAVEKVDKSKILQLMSKPGNADAADDAGLKGEDKAVWQAALDTKCEKVQIGEKAHDVILIPKEVNARFDAKKAEKGEANDPVVAWWRMYYGAKAEEQAKKLRNISKHISPFETDVHRVELADVKVMRPKSVQEYFDKQLDDALDN
jgi:hypothetical protein